MKKILLILIAGKIYLFAILVFERKLGE